MTATTRTAISRRRTSRTLLPALTLAAGLALTGCQTGAPGVAAFVADEEISVDHVQELTGDVAAGLPQEQVSSDLQHQVLNELVVAEVFAQVAEERGIEVTPSDLDLVRAQLQVPETLPEDLVEPLLRTRVIAQTLAESEGAEAANAAVLDAATSLEIEVNPRYGEWDGETLTVEPLISGGLAESLFQATVPGEGQPVPGADDVPVEAP